MDSQKEIGYRDFTPPTDPEHIFDPLRDISIETAFKLLIKKYLAPWSSINFNTKTAAIITKRMLNVMEFSYKGGSFRIRIVDNILYYRQIITYDQSYRAQRMKWYLNLLLEMIQDGMFEGINTDMIIYVGDSGKVPQDTFMADSGFPLFSIRTSASFLDESTKGLGLLIDIPIPDPAAFGSNGKYTWSDADASKKIKWESKISKLVFRGRGSCLKMQADNWHVCTRVRAQKLADQYPDILDIGIMEWNQIGKTGGATFPKIYPNITSSSVKEVEQSTGLNLKKYLSHKEQSKFKYIFDIDGGLGSSRKEGILADSGSLLFSQISPWMNFFEPLLSPFVHYIPVDRHFKNLVHMVEWAKSNDEIAKKVQENGKSFADKFLNRESLKRYLELLIREYSKLLTEAVTNEPIDIDYCPAAPSEIPKGPLGCRKDWEIWSQYSEDYYKSKKSNKQ